MHDQPASVENSDAYKSAPSRRNVPDATRTVSILRHYDKAITGLLLCVYAWLLRFVTRWGGPGGIEACP